MPSTQQSRSRARVFAEDYGLLVVAAFFALLGVVGVALWVFGDTAYARTLVDRYGLAALFLIFVLEGAMLLYFAPSELVVPISVGVLAQAGPDSYDLGVVAAILVVAIVGATVGQTALFLLAKRGGREWLLRKPWFRVSEGRLDRFDSWFQRWGPVVVPVSNFLPFTRGMLTVPAGVAEMRTRRFALLSAAGTLVFEAVLAAATLGLVSLGIV